MTTLRTGGYHPALQADRIVEALARGGDCPFFSLRRLLHFRGDGARACSVRAQPVFGSFLGLTPCLCAWCFLPLRHLSTEAFGGQRTQVRKWRVHCLLDGLMSLAARLFGNVPACVWHWPYVILADWAQVMVNLERSGGRKHVQCNDIAGASMSPRDSGRALFCFALAPLTNPAIALRASG